MKKFKKLLVSTVIVLSILMTSSVDSFAATNTTSNIPQQQQLFDSSRLPQGNLYGDLQIGQDVIAWEGSYNQYQVSIREWASLESFQRNPDTGGSTLNVTVINGKTSYKYQFKTGRVYRVWVYGKDAGQLFSIGAYEWQQ